MQSCLALAAGLVVAQTSTLGSRANISARATQTLAAMNHDQVLVVEDGAFPEEYLNELYNGILNITLRGGKGRVRPYQFAPAFQNAYTFFFTSTLKGLAYASAVLELPLERFVDHGLDPTCNAFFLNAVVLSADMAPMKPPWRDFAITVHADQSLRVHAADVSLPDDGTARTVVILYLNDVFAGGELEVYEHFELAEAVHRDAQDHAALQCQKKVGASKAQCEARVIDRMIRNTTVGRIVPRKGRLVRFQGSHSHAVRRLHSKARMSTHDLRISLVLEQFHYPQGVLNRIPMVWSEHKGRPFFASTALRNQFVTSAGGPRIWGAA